MALERRSPKSEGKSEVEYKLLEAGDHDARLVFVADLGLQRKEYKGEYMGDFQQIALGLEIVGESVTVDGKERPRIMWTRPFYIYDTLTEKGVELKMYKTFVPTATDGQVPDWDSQLGKPCNVVVIHKEGSGANTGKKFDNIADISAIPAKYQDAITPAVTTPAIGEGKEVTDNLYGLAKFVYDKRIKEVATDTPNQEPRGESQNHFDDDIPF